ncbi:ABC transporter permease, partial [Bacteroidota bacterium]
EIEIDNFNDIDYMSEIIADIVGYNYAEDQDFLMITNIKEKHVQIFDWLNLQDMNVWVILILMLIVAGFNMVSGLLILILERTNMIGILKALGANNINIRKIFLYQSGFLISKGLLWGNIIGIAICLIQYYFQPFKLDQASYFLNTVPINFNIFYFLVLNIGTLLLTMLMLLIPSHIIANISPDKSIRFD